MLSDYPFLFHRHTQEMIQKLESAGLGYHVSADETEDKLGIMLILFSKPLLFKIEKMKSATNFRFSRGRKTNDHLIHRALSSF